MRMFAIDGVEIEKFPKDLLIHDMQTAAPEHNTCMRVVGLQDSLINREIVSCHKNLFNR